MNDISEEDAKAEGAECRFEIDAADFVRGKPVTSTYRIGYKHLWESINGEGSWDENPWVWVIHFERVSP